jgi:hypothetical protein
MLKAGVEVWNQWRREHYSEARPDFSDADLSEANLREANLLGANLLWANLGDLPTSLAAFLKAYTGDRTSGFLFQSKSGRPLTQRNVLRDGLGKIRRDLKLGRGKAFHAFRRFRTAHLRKNRVPWDLQKLWLGHANRDVTDRYAEQLKEDVEWRKEVAENTGLGFELPTVESSVGLLGLPSGKKMKVKKAA